MNPELEKAPKIFVSRIGSVVTKELFAELSGLSVGAVKTMMYSGDLPTVKVGKRRLINYALFSKECLDEEFEL